MNPDTVDVTTGLVTAGLGGFLAFFLLAVALYFLMRNMNARLRRMAYREAAEASAADAGSPPDQPGVAGQKGGPRDGPDIG